jgi:uncharacterized protein YjbI with pentapeptide repeats
MRWPDWSGVGERRWKRTPDEEVRPAKTAWDWLQLLIVPAILAAIAVAFNAAETSRDRSREDRRTREDRALAENAREDATLESYFKQMSGLMLDRHLRSADSESDVASVARTITLATLRRLNGARKAEVISFLSEGKLLQTTIDAAGTGVDLSGADLRGADFRDTDLGVYEGTMFDKVDLEGARFDRATLTNVFFLLANLRGASFKGSRLRGVRFKGSDLTGAVFDGAYLTMTPLYGAEFQEPTTFELSCITNTRFARAYFNDTAFELVRGRGVDFSNALLQKISPADAALTDVRLDGASEPSPGWAAKNLITRDQALKNDPCEQLNLISPLDIQQAGGVPLHH